MVEHIRPIRERYDDLSKNKDYLVNVYEKGAERAGKLAFRTISKVKKKVGFIV